MEESTVSGNVTVIKDKFLYAVLFVLVDGVGSMVVLLRRLYHIVCVNGILELLFSLLASFQVDCNPLVCVVCPSRLIFFK